MNVRSIPHIDLPRREGALNRFLFLRNIEDVILPEVEPLDVLVEGIQDKFDILHRVDLSGQAVVLKGTRELDDGVI